MRKRREKSTLKPARMQSTQMEKCDNTARNVGPDFCIIPHQYQMVWLPVPVITEVYIGIRMTGALIQMPASFETGANTAHWTTNPASAH